MKFGTGVIAMFTALGGIAAAQAQEGYTYEGYAKDYGKVQKIRFIQDNAQNYMVSKVYELKHVKANDLTPFVTGAVKRYDSNSSVTRLNYKAANKQFITVTTDVRLMKYIDDMVAKLDRPGGMNGGTPIEGTGIYYDFYTPKYRPGQEMLDIILSAGISSTSIMDARFGYEPSTNQIYWKDGNYKNSDIQKYLEWLDRPLPQINMTFNIYEVRESSLRDLGVDYLAWKNGPGYNLFGTGAEFFNVNASEALFNLLTQSNFDVLTQSFSGGYGAFFVAPAFDASFLRLLQQDGRATLHSTVNLTVMNRDNSSYKIGFAPEFQNIKKTDKDKSSVGTGKVAPIQLTVTNPNICFRAAADAKTGRIPSDVEAYRKKELGGIVNFAYTLNVNNVVERNNYGDELYETSVLNSTLSAEIGNKKLLGKWSKDIDVEQTIGIPFLCEIPILKYVFGTTTTNKEKTFFFLTVESGFAHPDEDFENIAGKLVQLNPWINEEQK